MIERVRNRFKKAEQTSFQIPKEIAWDDERRAEAYLDTLDGLTRASVEKFLIASNEIQDKLGDTKIAVTAVGSSTRPANKRYHVVSDIDLRILNSEETNSPDRESTISTIRDYVRVYLDASRVDYREEYNTVKKYMIPGMTNDQETGEQVEKRLPYLDWYNNDPSFITYPMVGRPLHISISGLDNYALKEYLEIEQENKTSAVLLMRPIEY